MKTLRIVSLAATLTAAAQSFACPTGDFDVSGWNPGVSADVEPSYRGTATITAVGQVCRMEWRIGAQHFGGVGFYDEELKRLDIAYANLKEGWFGEVSYQLEGAVFNGRWAVYGESQGRIGKELLFRK